MGVATCFIFHLNKIVVKSFKKDVFGWLVFSSCLSYFGIANVRKRLLPLTQNGIIQKEIRLYTRNLK